MTPLEIRLMRKRFFMTQEALAKNLGVRDNAVSDWELGYRKPNEKNVKKLCILSKQLSHALNAECHIHLAGRPDFTSR